MAKVSVNKVVSGMTREVEFLDVTGFAGKADGGAGKKEGTKTVNGAPDAVGKTRAPCPSFSTEDQKSRTVKATSPHYW